MTSRYYDEDLYNPGTGPTGTYDGGTTYGGGYTGGGNTYNTPYSGYSTKAPGTSRKWAGDYTFYDKLFEQALQENQVEKGQGDYWMGQDQQAWEAEGDWLNQRPGQYGGYGVPRPGDFSFDGQRPTAPGVEAFDDAAWTGPGRATPYMDEAFHGQLGWEDYRKEYENLKNTGPGSDYKGWTDATMDAYDADAAFQKYMEGANLRYRGTLQDQLDELSQTAAGRGRLNTGYFELDTGDLGRKLSDDFRADTMQKALDTSALNLDYIKAKGNLALGNQEGRLKAYNTGNTLRQGWADTFSKFAGTYGDLRSKANAQGADMLASDRTFAKDAWQNRFDMNAKKYDMENSAYEDDRDFAYKGHRDKNADWENDRDFDQSTWRDNYEAWSDTAGIYRGRSEAGSQNAKDWRDRYVDTQTGLRGEWLGREEAAKDRKAGKDASKRQMWGNIFGGVLKAASSFIP